MNELVFGDSALLALLAVVLLALLGRMWWASRIARGQRSIGVLTPGLMPTAGRYLGRLRLILFCAGLCLVVVAISRPRWGFHEEERETSGFNVAVVLDCSRSMEAEDLYPNRSRAARLKALDLLALEPSARIALIPFAGRAVLRCPLTGDRNALSIMLEDCTPELFELSQQGTAIGEATDLAVRTLAGRADRAQAVLILSDGDDPDSEAVSAAAELAQSEGIPVYGILMAAPDRRASITIDGREQEVGANAETLDTLTRSTGGIPVVATTDTSDVQSIVNHLREHLDSLSWVERRRTVQRERYRWALLPAIALIALAALTTTRRRREPRPILEKSHLP
jgi:Ca-activated chloride channel family protein